MGQTLFPKMNHVFIHLIIYILPTEESFVVFLVRVNLSYMFTRKILIHLLSIRGPDTVVGTSPILYLI